MKRSHKIGLGILIFAVAGFTATRIILYNSSAYSVALEKISADKEIVKDGVEPDCRLGWYGSKLHQDAVSGKAELFLICDSAKNGRVKIHIDLVKRGGNWSVESYDSSLAGVGLAR